ncbi:MAG: AAA family ATPase [Desulfobacterales bacterium]|nr:AAA family ATPase [Desulfobacterales bacterium]
MGPSGVGKTETALALADLLYGGERNLITINMSEFQEAHTVSTPEGLASGLRGLRRGRRAHRGGAPRGPTAVVLLDEVEKAHPDVLELFYQVFDKGMHGGRRGPRDRLQEHASSSSPRTPAPTPS